MMTWRLFGTTVLVSVLVVAIWDALFQPALRWYSLKLLKWLSESQVIFSAMGRACSSLISVAATLGDALFKVVWQAGGAEAFSVYLAVLILMVLFALFEKVSMQKKILIF